MYCDGHVLFSIFAYKAVEHHDCEVDSDEIGRQRLPILTKHNNTITCPVPGASVTRPSNTLQYYCLLSPYPTRIMAHYYT